jgi:hypothetical protein
MNWRIPAEWRNLLDQVRANPRLQAGIGAIGLLLVAWIVLVLGDLRQAQIARLEQARARYIQVKQLSGQDVWLQRAAEAAKLADALEAEIPQAASGGLAQAQFQGWLKTIADSQGTPIRIDTQAPSRLEAPSAGIVRVTATLAGSMDPQRAWQLVHRIEGTTALVTIPAITVRSDGSNQTFSLTAQGYYRVPDATTAPAAEDKP